MTALLTKIDRPKPSRNGDTPFFRLYFRIAGKGWAATDVCPNYRNFALWKPVIDAGIGTVIDGAILRQADKIDADSQIRIIRKEESPQMKLL